MLGLGRKTFTMMGGSGSDAGIVIRALSDVFSREYCLHSAFEYNKSCCSIIPWFLMLEHSTHGVVSVIKTHMLLVLDFNIQVWSVFEWLLGQLIGWR